MKKLIVIVAGLFMAVSAGAQFSKARLQATGLTCAMCSNAINKSLEKVSFVESVRSDIKNSAFNITFKKDMEPDIDELRKAVEDAGFAVGSLALTGQFEKVQVGNDQHVLIGKRAFHFLNITDQVLDGEKTLVLADKDFMTAKEFKKIKSATKMNCVNTGKAEACCVGVEAGKRIYHVTI